MRLFSHRPLAVGAIAIFVLVGRSAMTQDGSNFGIGQPVSESELRNWNIDVGTDGAGLPPGQGSVQAGRAIYEAKCLACHGVDGQGQPMDQLAGGQGTLTSTKPVKTIGSYWPYATTVFDYVRRAMPTTNPLSLTDGEVYAVTAYVLHLNGIIGDNAVMDARTLPQVNMPNRDGFVDWSRR